MVLTGLINSFEYLIQNSSSIKNDKYALLYISSGLLAASIAIFSNYSLSNKNSDDKILPALPLDETRAIMSNLSDNVKLLGSRMLVGAENIKQQLAQQNQQVSDMDIMKSYILPYFLSGLKDIQDNLLNQYDIEENELEEAVDEYIAQGDSKLIEIKRKVRAIYTQFGGELEDDEAEVVEEPPKDVPLNVIITAINGISDLMDSKMDEYIETFKSKYGVPSDMQTFEAFQRGMISLSEDSEKIVLEQLNITNKDFETSVVKHQENQTLQFAYMKMQTNNQKKLFEAGMIPANMM